MSYLPIIDMVQKLNILAFLIVSFFFGCSGQNNKIVEYKLDRKSAEVDTSFIQKVTIDSVCPCQTTIADLNIQDNLIPIKTAELDSNICSQGNAETQTIKEFLMQNRTGIIIEQDENTEYISKIRLTKNFEGKLPNQVFIKLKDITVKDIVKIYPTFDFRTTDCSNYWRYTNDTISFYIKIDKSIKKYPLDEEFYSNKPIEAVEIAVWCFHVYAPTQIGDIVYEKPLYSPLSDSHLNTYVMKTRNDIGTKMKEVLSTGKKTNYDMIRLGKWIEYSSDHRIILEEVYDNKGNLINKIK